MANCPKCSSTNLRVDYEDMHTACDDCGLIILAIPVPELNGETTR